MVILQLQNIHKAFGANKALNGISLDIPQGSIFGILGPNGSGKTTLLGIILDILKADEGNFTWFEGNSNEYRKQIGTLLETPNFYHYLSAVNNLEITKQISGRGSRGEIDNILREINLYERRNSPFSSYSLGMKQRLAIGAALLGSPSVVVLDEPTNGLDPVGIAEIRQLIIDLNKKGHTIIIASHLLDEVEKVCTHVAIMKKGDLLACGPVHEILAEEDIVEVAARNNEELFKVIKEFPGLLHYKNDNGKIILGLPKNFDALEEINRFCLSKEIVLNHLYLRKQRLEARFFELTKN